MTRALPAHITPSAVMAAAERMFRADATKRVHDEARRRKIHPSTTQFWIEQQVAVRLYEFMLLLLLPMGGGDDYCI